MYTGPRDKEELKFGDPDVGLGGLTESSLSCARCGVPIDQATRCLDGEYDLVCQQCYSYYPNTGTQ